MPPNRSLHPMCYDWLRPQVNFSVERLLQVGVFGQRESRTGPEVDFVTPRKLTFPAIARARRKLTMPGSAH